jgi:4-amino-4-deoxy-L-arabinose transferase-like glycosyltransferase
VTGLPVARLLALAVPIVCVGLFARVLYTPDEPREAGLVVAMTTQADKALPEFAGRPFAEKPPLLYWLGAASVGAFGASPAGERLPNLLYALVTVLAIGALAARAAGASAGFAAGVVAASALQSYQVQIWLATDAPLLAGVALALYGAFLGLTAADARARLGGYLLLHAGLAVAFFAKGFAGWLVPVTAFLVVVVAERRPRELARVELWAGVPLLALLIGAWVVWLDSSPGGRDSLRVLFWYNLVGRALPISAPAEFTYASGHQNSAGKYLLELPFYLLPWTALALAALRRAPRGWRAPGALGTAWHLALGAIVPATVVLSLAATARGIYYAPVLLGFALMIGLYTGDAATALDRFERACWRLTGVLIALLALGLAALALLLCLAPAWRDGASVVLALVALAGAALAAWFALTPPVAAAGALPRQALAMALTLTLVCGPMFARLNGWLSLETLSSRVLAAAGSHPLIVLDADETTLAMVQLYFPKSPPVQLVATGSGADPTPLAAALLASGGQARVVVALKDGARWDLGTWLAYLGYRAPAAAVPAPLPPALSGLRLECRLVRPGGRILALLVQADAPPAPAAPCG